MNMKMLLRGKREYLFARPSDATPDSPNDKERGGRARLLQKTFSLLIDMRYTARQIRRRGQPKPQR
jgi:hypothetical protein